MINIEMINNFSQEDLLEMELHQPYFANCIAESDDYSYNEFYVIERDYNDVFKIYNTSILVSCITALSKNPINILKMPREKLDD